MISPNPSNLKLAPHRYRELGKDIIKPLSEEDQQALLQEHYRQIKTQRTACYCMLCRDGINRGGGEAVHLLDLLFPAK